MNKLNPLIGLIVCGAVLLASAMLAARSVWIVHRALIFARNGESLSFGQLRVHAEPLRLHLAQGISGTGPVEVRRAGATEVVTPPAGRKMVVRLVRAGDELCAPSLSACSVASKETLLAVVDDRAGGWWSTRSVKLSGWDAPLSSGITLSSAQQDAVLVTLPDGSRSVIAGIEPGVNHVDTRPLADISLRKLAFATAFCLLSMLLALAALVHREEAVRRVRRVPVFAAVLGLQLCLQYLSVFPGMFATDTVVTAVEAGGFDDWYSVAYMLWAYLSSPLTPLFIQLPSVIFYYAVTIYLASELAELRRARLWLTLSFLFQLLSPVVFVMLFAQQRIFVAALLLYGAMIVAFVGIVRNGSPGRAGWILLTAAALLRSEYILYLLAFMVLTIPRGSKVSALLPSARVLLSVVGTMLFLNVVLPSLSTDGHNSRVHYGMTLLLDIIRPYVRCNEGNEPLRPVFDSIGGFAAYCSDSPENFFWSKMDGIDPAAEGAAHETLRAALVARTASDPAPAIHRFGERFGDIAAQPAWQIYNRYEPDPDVVKNIHVLFAEAHALARYYTWQSPLTAAVTSFYHGLSRWLTIFVWMAIACILVPLFSRAREISILNGVTVLIAVLCTALSPAVNWSYLIAVPLWCLLVVPFSALATQGSQPALR